MSEIERPPGEPARQPPDQSLLPPANPESLGVPAWAPPPPPAPPTGTTLWHRLAAGVVVATVVAGAAGAGIGWSVARAIHPPASTAQTITPSTQPQTDSESPIRPTTPRIRGSLDPKAIAAKVDPAIVDINTIVGTGQAAGTGMIIGSSGEVLTNDHVIQGSTKITVTIAGRSQSYTAHLIAAVPTADIAVIQIEGASGLPTVSFASSSTLVVGDSIVAIGNALGQGGTPAVSQGSITALDQTITASEAGAKAEQLAGMIQSDATIYPGDSGGPLLNSFAQVVGMITAGQVQGVRNSPSNVSYAIASDTLLDVVNQIRSHATNSAIRYSQDAYIGVNARTLDAATAAQLGLNVSSGALVRSVVPGSPAAGAGITRDSVITSVGGTPVTSIDTLGTAIKAHKPGEKVSVSWVNQSGPHTATLTLSGMNP